MVDEQKKEMKEEKEKKEQNFRSSSQSIQMFDEEAVRKEEMIKSDFDKEKREAENDKEKIQTAKKVFNEGIFQNLIKYGDEDFNQKDYEHALTKYEQALVIKSDDNILNKINNAKKMIDEVDKNKKEKDALIESETKSFAVQIETFNLKYNELKEKIKNLRKEGKDPYIADLHITPFQSKLLLAEITRLQRDLDVVKNLLSLVEKELKEVENEKVEDVVLEIEDGAKALIEEDIKRQASG